jgi:hypothetical protein
MAQFSAASRSDVPNAMSELALRFSFGLYLSFFMECEIHKRSSPANNPMAGCSTSWFSVLALIDVSPTS